MSSKNKTEVLIAGKIFTLSWYESEEYLQKVATYINNKIAEFKKLDEKGHQAMREAVAYPRDLPDYVGMENFIAPKYQL